MRSCTRLQRSLTLAGFNLGRPAAHFYSTNGAVANSEPASSKKKRTPGPAPQKAPTKSTKTLRGKRLERDEQNLPFDQWSWSEVNLDDKTIQTAAGKLPISPLLDSTWVEARQRKKPKARPDKSAQNRFQRQLRQNPYAQLLATPVRLCGLTRVLLPKSMLQSFALVRRPETNEVWWLPEGLHTPREQAKEEPDETEEADDPSSAATNGETGDGAAAGAAGGDSSGAAEKQATYRYPIRVLARKDLVDNFGTVGRKNYGGHKRLVSNPGVPPVAKTAHWRPDMYPVIVDQRRRHIMDDLLYLTALCEENGRKYIIRVTNAKYTATYVHRAAFLWLGEDKALDSEGGDQESTGEGGQAEKKEVGPEQYATLDIDGNPTTTRPVYNLPKLLGSANVAQLRSQTSVFKDGSLFLLRSQRSGNVNMKLWSLQGFMADHTPSGKGASRMRKDNSGHIRQQRLATTDFCYSQDDGPVEGDDV